MFPFTQSHNPIQSHYNFNDSLAEFAKFALTRKEKKKEMNDT